MEKSQKSIKLICPECDSEIKSNFKIKIGDVVECEKCTIESEIISVNPVKLAPLEEEK